MSRSLRVLTVLLVFGCGIGQPWSAQEKVPAVNAKLALERALGVLQDQPKNWAGGCDIRVRRGKGAWIVSFEPVPMGPGLDVMVTVHDNGRTTVDPGY